MKATSYMKQHKANEFYVKKSRGYYMVIDGSRTECNERQEIKYSISLIGRAKALRNIEDYEGNK